MKEIFFKCDKCNNKIENCIGEYVDEERDIHRIKLMKGNDHRQSDKNIDISSHFEKEYQLCTQCFDKIANYIITKVDGKKEETRKVGIQSDEDDSENIKSTSSHKPAQFYGKGQGLRSRRE